MDGEVVLYRGGLVGLGLIENRGGWVCLGEDIGGRDCRWVIDRVVTWVVVVVGGTVFEWDKHGLQYGEGSLVLRG